MRRDTTRIIDLTHTIAEDMPVFPDAEPPRIQSLFRIEKDGFAEKRLRLFTHIGTHMDAPAHLLTAGPGLDELPVDHFVGSGLSLPVAQGPPVEASDLEPFGDQIAAVSFLLLHTGWSRHWGQEAYFHGFPLLSEETAKWLCQFNLKGLGLDAISVDPVDSREMPIHKILLGHGLVLIENLTNLAALTGSPFTFVGLPLKFRQADGSPVRAVARLD